MSLWKKLFRGEKKERTCDRCGTTVISSGGYLFDKKKEEIEKRLSFVRLAVEAGAAGVLANFNPVSFVCEACLTGIHVDPVMKLMSRTRAMHFWDKEEFERLMFAEDFPPESEESRLPWMSAALEAECKKKCGGELSLEAYLSLRADCLARFLAQNARKATVPNNPWAMEPRGFAVVIAEMPIDSGWEKWLMRFIERRLLADIGAQTKVWFVRYQDAADIWFTKRLEEYVAIAIALVLGQNPDQLGFKSYIDNQSRRCLIVLG